MANKHGDWIWYELMTPDPRAARAFYEDVVGAWAIDEAGQGESEYRMIHASEGDVGGVLTLTPAMQAGGARPMWLGYIGVEDVDKSVAAIEAAGGKTHHPAIDIPGTGRFAMVADPQDAPFYVMRGAPDETSHAFAADRPMDGHCAWNELSTTDPEAAKAFYGAQFGWVKDGEMDMGPMGAYEFLRHGVVHGAVMPKPNDMPCPSWTFYFRTSHDIDTAAAKVPAAGGTVLHGPQEIPGGEFILNAADPQGATFAVIGKRN